MSTIILIQGIEYRFLKSRKLFPCWSLEHACQVSSKFVVNYRIFMLLKFIFQEMELKFSIKILTGNVQLQVKAKLRLGTILLMR